MNIATNVKQLCQWPLHAFRYIRLIVVEALRLYPQPPLLIRRALKSDVLPGIDFYFVSLYLNIAYDSRKLFKGLESQSLISNIILMKHGEWIDHVD